MNESVRSTTPSVIIIGTGFGGLCMAIQLRNAGIETFTLLEKASGVGGTWRDNTYPGAACDVQSQTADIIVTATGQLNQPDRKSVV